MQVKTFTAWVNSHLAREKIEVQDLKTDFKDGIALIKLVEIIADENLGKYNKKPVRRSRGWSAPPQRAPKCRRASGRLRRVASPLSRRCQSSRRLRT